MTSDVVFENILIGEVWLASGQSNMKMTIAATDMSRAELDTLEDPFLRVTEIPMRVAARPESEVNTSWQAISPEMAPKCSSTPYYFARYLREKLNAPVGMVVSGQGHTPIEAWTDHETLSGLEPGRELLQKWEEQLRQTPEFVQELMLSYQAITKKQQEQDYGPRFTQWYEQAKQTHAQGQPIPTQPERATGPGDPWSPTVLFNGMIAPLIPFAIKGVIWYQGETNAIFDSADLYRQVFPEMIKSWRKLWGQEDFPFYFVQIANHEDVQTENADRKWAELRDAQTSALQLENTGMVVAIDIGETMNIHPQDKSSVGRRLANLALAKTYGFDNIACDIPKVKSVRVNDSECILSFEPEKPCILLRCPAKGTGFELAGQGGQFLPAQARLEGNQLYVWSDSVPKPAFIRYAWAADPSCSLFSSNELPLAPFRFELKY